MKTLLITVATAWLLAAGVAQAGQKMIGILRHAMPGIQRRRRAADAHGPWHQALGLNTRLQNARPLGSLRGSRGAGGFTAFLILHFGAHIMTASSVSQCDFGWNRCETGVRNGHSFGLASHRQIQAALDRARDQGLQIEQLPRVSLVQRAEIPRALLDLNDGERESGPEQLPVQMLRLFLPS